MINFVFAFKKIFVKGKCSNCGKEFRRRVYKNKADKIKYCGRLCYREYHKKRAYKRYHSKATKTLRGSSLQTA